MSPIEEFMEFRKFCPLCNRKLNLFINSSNNKCFIEKGYLAFTCEYKELSYYYKINIKSGKIKVKSNTKLSKLDYLLILFFYKSCSCHQYCYSSNKVITENNSISTPAIYQEQFFLKDWVIISSFKEEESILFSKNKEGTKIKLPILKINSIEDINYLLDDLTFL